MPATRELHNQCSNKESITTYTQCRSVAQIDSKEYMMGTDGHE